MKPIWRAVVLTLLGALVVAACQAEGRSFKTTLDSADRSPLAITLADETELVTGIDQAEFDSAWSDAVPALHALPNDPDAAVLSWLGGKCDGETTVRFHVVHGDYLLNLATHHAAGNCPAAGVPRALRIAMSRAIPVDSIVVAGGPQ